MIIAVDTEELKEEPGNFLHECLRRIIPLSPQHHFILLSRAYVLSNYKAVNNCFTILLKKKRRLPLIQEINRILNKEKAEIIITSDLLLAAFVKTKICLLTSSLQQFPSDKVEGLFIKYLAKKVYKKASIIYTAWEQDKKDIINRYKVLKDKVQIVHLGLNDVTKDLHFEQQQIIQSKYTEGNAYFLIAHSSLTTSEFLIFLKAFSVFKKRLKSKMQLLVYCKNYNNDKVPLEKVVKDYRFKSDVLIINANQVSPIEIFSAAYAFIFNTIKNNDINPALKSIATSSNVICLNTLIAKEIFADAALYFDEFNVDQIADKMITIYKDENLKKALSVKQQERQEHFSWNLSAADILQGIEALG
ncbi:MAG: hypothetical protein ABIR81_10740 [Ginsengibacter sp.]